MMNWSHESLPWNDDFIRSNGGLPWNERTDAQLRAMIWFFGSQPSGLTANETFSSHSSHTILTPFACVARSDATARGKGVYQVNERCGLYTDTDL